MTSDRDLALQVLEAVADDEGAALVRVLAEAGADNRLVALVVSLARIANANAEALAPDDWREQLRFISVIGPETPEGDGA